jgi:hypothetical protein
VTNPLQLERLPFPELFIKVKNTTFIFKYMLFVRMKRFSEMSQAEFIAEVEAIMHKTSGNQTP